MPPGRLPRVTAQQTLRALHRAGWNIDRQSGSHAVLLHESGRGRVIVPVHSRGTLRLGTLAAILQQAGLSIEEFEALL